jgi:hypothetical protein
MSRCRSCQAEVLWVQARFGRMPLDAEPNPLGNVVVHSPDQVVVYRDSTAALEAGVDPTKLHMSHFATCDVPAEWRGRRARP